MSNLVAGLYICEYCICVSNQSGSTANIFRFEANVQDTTAQQNQIHSHHNRESINIPNGFFHMHRNTFTFVNPATRSYILQYLVQNSGTTSIYVSSNVNFGTWFSFTKIG